MGAAGSYEGLKGGNTKAGLSLLTGYQAYYSRWIKQSKNKKFEHMAIFDTLLSYDKEDYLMTASIQFSMHAERCRDQKNALRSVGLRGRHAYTILGARKLRYGQGPCEKCNGTGKVRSWFTKKECTPCNGTGGTVRLVELRNPHGQGESEWKGKWSDGCRNWTDQLKEQCNWTNERDGRFFMSSEDFREHFTSYTICKYGEESEKIPNHCPTCKGTGKVNMHKVPRSRIVEISSSPLWNSYSTKAELCPRCPAGEEEEESVSEEEGGWTPYYSWRSGGSLLCLEVCPCQFEPLRQSYWHKEPRLL